MRKQSGTVAFWSKMMSTGDSAGFGPDSPDRVPPPHELEAREEPAHTMGIGVSPLVSMCTFQGVPKISVIGWGG